MKKLLFVLIGIITIIGSYGNANAQMPITFIVTTPEGVEMKFSILDKEKNTVKLLYYCFSPESSNEEILNIPSEIFYDGILYSVTAISSNAYSPRSDKNNIKILNIPNGIKYIRENAFEKCYFSTINLPPTLLEIDRHAFNMPVIIENPPMRGGGPLWRIEPHDLEGQLIISNHIETISDSAFGHCNCTTVTIGQNVKTIATYAFRFIDDIICCPTTPPINTDEVCIKYANLLVPPGCKEVYKQDENWGKAASIEEYEYYVNVEFDNLDILSHKILKGRLFKGQTRTLHPKITWLHEGSSERYRYWSSSDESVATVDQNGVITAKDFGEATITFMIEDERGVPFNCNYDIIVTTSADVDILEADDADTTVEVFTLNGLKVGETTNNLPAGLYIVKSAKEAKKICIK